MKNNKWFSSSLLEKYSKIIHGFSTKQMGDASSPENAKSIGKDLLHNKENLQLMNQCHGTDVEIINAIRSELPKVDSLITNLPNVALGVRTADCVPVFIFDPENSVISAIHAGWKGAADNIASKTIKKMRDVFKSKPGDLITVICPAIGECCFEVGQEVIDRFPSSSVAGGTHVDLGAAIITELTEDGVKRDRIDWLKICTACERELCYSHRRDQGKTGRHLALIMMCDK